MALVGIAILWVTIANWSSSPSLYLLFAELGLLAAGAPQLIKYFRSDKVEEIKYKCIDCGHQWEQRED